MHVSCSEVFTVSDAKAVDALDVWKKIITSKLVSRDFQSWLDTVRRLSCQTDFNGFKANFFISNALYFCTYFGQPRNLNVYFIVVL